MLTDDGSSPSEVTLPSRGDSWNHVVSKTRVYQSDFWYVWVELKYTGIGTGQQVGVLLRRYNSSCSVQQTMINTTIDVTSSSYNWYIVSALQSAVYVAPGDRLVVELRDSAGALPKVLRYDQADTGFSASMVITPDWYPPPWWHYWRNRMRRGQ